MSKAIKTVISKKDIDVNEYMNVTELSKFLKMSVSHIYSLTSTKKIPHIKLLGKKILFDKSEINNWLKSKSVSAK
jgi:excisionase family DNA binding protein